MMLLCLYLLKVVIVSTVLFGYYLLILKNKRFHHYNRIYLLAVVILSWSIPLMRIHFFQPASSKPAQVYQFMQLIADNNNEFEQLSGSGIANIDWQSHFYSIVVIVSLFFLALFLKNAYTIFYLIKNSPVRRWNKLSLVITDARGTPFSFFRYVFWSSDIDIESKVGKQMLLHEMVHVEEGHSFDKLLVEIGMVAGWFNPVFWFLRKELYLIHEFIADSKSIKNNDSSMLAEVLLAAAYPQQGQIIANHFFFSPIKRRLAMMKIPMTQRFSYLRRIFVLPVAAILVFLLAFRGKNIHMGDNHVSLKRKYTIVVDAGHGGSDHGAGSSAGEYEKDISLAIAQKIKYLNTDPGLDIILTREVDENLGLTDRVKRVKEIKPDLFLSIHTNAASTASKSGFEVFIPIQENPIHGASFEFAFNLFNAIKPVFHSEAIGIASRSEHRIYILENSPCPVALIECGFITNKDDLRIMKENQDDIAMKAIDGIRNYLNAKEGR